MYTAASVLPRVRLVAGLRGLCGLRATEASFDLDFTRRAGELDGVSESAYDFPFGPGTLDIPTDRGTCQGDRRTLEELKYAHVHQRLKDRKEMPPLHEYPPLPDLNRRLGLSTVPLAMMLEGDQIIHNEPDDNTLVCVLATALRTGPYDLARLVPEGQQSTDVLQRQGLLDEPSSETSDPGTLRLRRTDRDFTSMSTRTKLGRMNILEGHELKEYEYGCTMTTETNVRPVSSLNELAIGEDGRVSGSVRVGVISTVLYETAVPMRYPFIVVVAPRTHHIGNSNSATFNLSRMLESFLLGLVSCALEGREHARIVIPYPDIVLAFGPLLPGTVEMLRILREALQRYPVSILFAAPRCSTFLRDVMRRFFPSCEDVLPSCLRGANEHTYKERGWFNGLGGMQKPVVNLNSLHNDYPLDYVGISDFIAAKSFFRDKGIIRDCKSVNKETSLMCRDFRQTRTGMELFHNPDAANNIALVRRIIMAARSGDVDLSKTADQKFLFAANKQGATALVVIGPRFPTRDPDISDALKYLLRIVPLFTRTKVHVILVGAFPSLSSRWAARFGVLARFYNTPTLVKEGSDGEATISAIYIVGGDTTAATFAKAVLDAMALTYIQNDTVLFNSDIGTSAPSLQARTDNTVQVFKTPGGSDALKFLPLQNVELPVDVLTDIITQSI